tara:strand:- start:373 stop:531 length:159 start_codon:yes stop_codon:yes gene_type:complete
MLKTKFPSNPYVGMIFYCVYSKKTYEFLQDFDGYDKWYDITNEKLNPLSDLF